MRTCPTQKMPGAIQWWIGGSIKRLSTNTSGWTTDSLYVLEFEEQKLVNIFIDAELCDLEPSSRALLSEYYGRLAVRSTRVAIGPIHLWQWESRTEIINYRFKGSVQGENTFLFNKTDEILYIGMGRLLLHFLVTLNHALKLAIIIGQLGELS